MLVRYTLCIGGANSFGKACDLIFESGASFDESIPLLFGHLNDRDVLKLTLSATLTSNIF